MFHKEFMFPGYMLPGFINSFGSQGFAVLICEANEGGLCSPHLRSK